MDAFTDPMVRQIVIMSAVQMLKTEFILNALGYVIHIDPGPVLIVQYRDIDCVTFSKKRLAPMIRDTPVIRSLVADARSRNSDNTITDKSFPGGHVRIAASASPANLASLPIRYLFCDEIDKYPASSGPEGDPLTVAEGRLEEFSLCSKQILTCSPTVKGFSRIEKAYEESDRREYYVPCPFCGESQVLKWAQVKWDNSKGSREKRAATAVYCCEHCEREWDDISRWKAINRGEYRATGPFHGIAGFRINALCSLKRPLSYYAMRFLNAKDDPERLKAFVNTVLAETWVEKGEAPEWERLLERREDYAPGTVPAGGLILTAGVDVQRDRLEVEVVAWGRGMESWSVDYQIFEGKTSESAVWEKLAAYRLQAFPSKYGQPMSISRMFVDSGDQTQDVYLWVRDQRDPDQVQAIKGRDQSMMPVSEPKPVDVMSSGKKIRRGLRIRIIDTGHFKTALYGKLALRPPTEEERAQGLGYPPGYCHFPKGINYGDEHFKQLCSESLVTRKNRRTGRTKREWQQDRARNEVLDCRIYARAAAYSRGCDHWQDAHWRALEAHLGAASPERGRPFKSARPRGPGGVVETAPGISLRELREDSYWGNRTNNWLDR